MKRLRATQVNARTYSDPSSRSSTNTEYRRRRVVSNHSGRAVTSQRLDVIVFICVNVCLSLRNITLYKGFIKMFSFGKIRWCNIILAIDPSSATALRNVDRALRGEMKRILRLPLCTTDCVCYATMRGRGLGCGPGLKLSTEVTWSLHSSCGTSALSFRGSVDTAAGASVIGKAALPLWQGSWNLADCATLVPLRRCAEMGKTYST